MKRNVKCTGLIFIILTAFLHSCKKEEIPTISTSSLTNITSTSAVGGGNITSDGNADVTSRGVCWSLEPNPTTKDSKDEEGTGAGQFVNNISGLNAGTTYHVRAYATNSAGTAYGADLSFATLGNVPECLTQAATNITSSGATLNGTVNANYLSTTVTFEYGITTTYGQTFTSSQSPVTGNSITNVSADISGLTPGTTYHYRVVAANSIGTTNGNDLTFTTGAVLPMLTTTPVSNRTATSVTTGGNITSDGGSAITARGVCWATTPYPTILNNKTSNGTGTEAFTSNITALTPGMSYYVRAYATNSSGTAYGDDLSFTTLLGFSTVSTASVTGVAQTSAISGGIVTSAGGSLVTARGVCWGTGANPNIAGSHTSNGIGTGSFISNLTSLIPGTTYYVRAYATNSSGTSYGSDLDFITLPVVPTVTTLPASLITASTATTGGNVTANGGSSVTEKGICWSTAPNPAIDGLHTSDGAGNGTFTSNLIGLNPNTVFYVRAYAINSAGIAYGNEVSFTTLPITLATLTTNTTISITEITAFSGGNITNDGRSYITERGVCWATNVNPTTSDDRTIDGTGTGSFTSSLTGLRCGTKYYVRAYAINTFGIAYGDQQSFTTKMIPTIFNPNLTYSSVSDLDGNLYRTIQIGTQTWMAENLRTTKYNDGSIIPNVTDDTDWANSIIGAYCWYNNDDQTYKTTYGALYNWFAVNTSKLCPLGWHVPFNDDWTILSYYFGGDLISGGKMKEVSTTHWANPNNDADNYSGFTALPGGRRANFGHFDTSTGQVGYWWRPTERVGTNYAWSVGISYNTGALTRGNSYLKSEGFSVRCVKD